jgi:hypothetical protein
MFYHRVEFKVVGDRLLVDKWCLTTSKEKDSEYVKYFQSNETPRRFISNPRNYEYHDNKLIRFR